MDEKIELYKVNIKANIGELVNSNKLEEAKEIINAYERIINDDIEIYSIKGVVSIMEGSMLEAEKILKEGLNISPLNYDLIYNLAYLYECNQNYEMAHNYYKRIVNVSDEEQRNYISVKIIELENLINNERMSFLEKCKYNNNEEAPLITIETWAYNVEQYIEQCVKSVLNQTFVNFEWVIIDNGCTDKTTEILEKYAKLDRRIKLFKNKKNTFTHGEPVNQGFVEYIENLKSEYWCMLDSDDYIGETFLEELYYKGKKYDCDIVLCSTNMFRDTDNKNLVTRHAPEFYTNDITTIGDMFQNIYGCFRPMWAKLFKVSLIKKQLQSRKENLKLSMRNGGDTIFCLDILNYTSSVAGVDKVLHNYRVRQNSLYNSQLNESRYLDYLDIYNCSKKLLQSWNKLNDNNLNFIAQVLYASIIDCIKIAENSINAPIEKRIKVISLILANIDIRTILNNSGLLINLLNEVTEGLDIIAETKKESKKKQII